MRLHHVQVGCPPGGEAAARAFWAGLLDLAEVAKPPALAARGGAWFEARGPDGVVTAAIHVGVEQAFRPARKAHPALVVDDLHVVLERARAAGVPVDDSERDTFPGFVRAHVEDPFGNRVELLQAREGPGSAAAPEPRATP